MGSRWRRRAVRDKKIYEKQITKMARKDRDRDRKKEREGAEE